MFAILRSISHLFSNENFRLSSTEWNFNQKGYSTWDKSEETQDEVSWSSRNQWPMNLCRSGEKTEEIAQQLSEEKAKEKSVFELIPSVLINKIVSFLELNNDVWKVKSLSRTFRKINIPFFSLSGILMNFYQDLEVVNVNLRGFRHPDELDEAYGKYVTTGFYAICEPNEQGKILKLEDIITNKELELKKCDSKPVLFRILFGYRSMNWKGPIDEPDNAIVNNDWPEVEPNKDFQWPFISFVSEDHPLKKYRNIIISIFLKKMQQRCNKAWKIAKKRKIQQIETTTYPSLPIQPWLLAITINKEHETSNKHSFFIKQPIDQVPRSKACTIL